MVQELKSKKLDILNASLEKKHARLDEKVNNHTKEVEKANGQPLNDKKIGAKTLKKWATSEELIFKQFKEIEKTKNAIDREETKIRHVESVSEKLPDFIIEKIEDGTILQWRKYPNRFFVKDVEKARIIYCFKKQCLLVSHLSHIPTEEQKLIFKEVCKFLTEEEKKSKNNT